jgi:hypothetical protein
VIIECTTNPIIKKNFSKFLHFFSSISLANVLADT